MQVTRTAHSEEVTGLHDYEIERKLTQQEYEEFVASGYNDFCHYNETKLMIEFEEGCTIDEIVTVLEIFRAL
jgi:hypothetical protein